jgi:hypothetical protein
VKAGEEQAGRQAITGFSGKTATACVPACLLSVPVSFFNFFKYKDLVLNMLVYRTAMKSNFKLAPVSCHCKLNELIPHLKNMSVQQNSDSVKGTVIVHPATAEYLMKRYI